MTIVSTWGRRRRAAGLAQGAVFLGLPFLTVNGESALRLDVPAGRLHVFGASLAVDEAFVVLLALVAATLVFLLATLVLGRAWCGWSCPQTVLSDLTPWLDARRGGRGARSAVRRTLALAGAAAVSAGTAAAFLWYFVPPQEFAARLAAGRLGPVLGWSWAALAAVLFADLAFVRQTFCATVCPYARLQGVLLDGASLVVAYDRTRAAECVECGACVRVCPTEIDIRDGLQAECIACAACIDACRPIMLRLGRRPDLVGWFLGPPRDEAAPRVSVGRRLVRPAVLMLAAAAAVSLGALVAAAALRDPLALEVSADAGFAPRRSADGAAIGAFAVALENRTRRPVSVALALAAGDPAARLAVRPARVELGPGERRSVRVLATAEGLRPGVVRARLVAEVREGGRPVGREDAAVALVIPEER